MRRERGRRSRNIEREYKYRVKRKDIFSTKRTKPKPRSQPTTLRRAEMGDEVDLHSAARAGDVDALGKCIAAGADVNGPDRHKRTALHLAAYAGQLDAIRFLIASGAKTAVEAMDGIAPLHFACQKGHWEVARELINLGANQKALNYKGENALHFAALSGNQKLVEMLLRKQVNPCHRSKRGKLPSECAKDEVVRAILEAAAAAKEAHILSTQAGIAEAKGEENADEEGAIGPSIGPAIGPSIGPPGRPDIGPSIGPPAAPEATGTEPSSGPSGTEEEDAPAIGPPVGPPARDRPAGIREKREIAEVEDAPDDALAAANTGGPSKKAKKAKAPVLSFGDDD